MVLKVWNGFVKRANSTLRPTEITPVEYNVVLKERTSMNRPTLILKSANATRDLQYANYAFFNGTYYFIEDITSISLDLVELSLRPDWLATYKTEIQDTRQFIQYAASEPPSPNASNWKYIPDMRATPIKRVNMSTFPLYPENIDTLPTWDPADPDFNEPLYTDQYMRYGWFPNSDGTVILTIASDDSQASNGFTSVYSITPSNMSAFRTLLYGGGLQQIVNKFLTNPYDAVISAHWIPWKTLFINGHELKVGISSFPDVIVNPIGGQYDSFNIQPCRFALSDFSNAGNFRDLPPFSQYEIYLPFYGYREIDMDKIGDLIRFDTTYLYVYIIPDPVKGVIDYIITDAPASGGASTRMYYYDHVVADTAVPIAVGQTKDNALPGIGQVAGASVATVSAVAAAATSPIATAAAVAGGLNVTSGLINTFRSSSSGGGNNGSKASAYQLLARPYNHAFRRLHLRKRTMTLSDDISNMYSIAGRPIYRVDDLTNYSGYIKCSNAIIDLPGRAEAREIVTNYMNEGFFLD